MSSAAEEDAERRKGVIRAALDAYLFRQHPLSFPVCVSLFLGNKETP